MELIKIGILGYSGFLGARLCNDLKNHFKIKKIKKSLRINRYENFNTLICSAGPNKFWCLKNKKIIVDRTKKFFKKINNYCKINKVERIVYFSSIHVINNNDKNLNPYIKWHRNMEKNLSNTNLKVLIIRLPNIFGRPKKLKKDFWNFFINLIIKKSVTNKKLTIKNNPKKKLYAYPLNFFVNFLIKEIQKKFIKNTKIINLNKNFRFNTFQLIYLIKKIMLQNNYYLNYEFKNNELNEYRFEKKMKLKEKKFFKEELINLLNFGKKSFNAK